MKPEPSAPSVSLAARRACLSLPLLGLAACAGVSQRGGDAPGPATGTPTRPAPVPPAVRTLASEQRRLASALQGTPVVVETTPEGRLRVAVPLEFSFERRRSAVRPALAAVLDRVAPGLRETPSFALRIAAPADDGGGGGSLLAQDRAAAVRDYLVAKGVPRPRIVETSRLAEPLVELLVSDRTG